MGQPAAKKNTLFIVDDTPDNLRLLATLLSAQGYTIRKALSAIFALKSIRQFPPDLILLDINMPDMSGYSICEALKADPATAEIPVIFISALDNVGDKVKAFQVGGADYIAKPFQMEEVLARIEHQLLLQAQKRQLKAEILERERAEKALEVYLHVVSHDLRNPVLGMSMVLNHCLNSVAADQDMVAIKREILEQMHQSCDRQLALINSLVETQQFEQQGVPLVLRSLSLQTLIEDLLKDWALRFEAQAVNVDIEFPPSLPLIQADANYLWRVFDNLIANALKYNPQPRPQPLTLQILVTVTATDILCHVIDDGVGINPAIADRVFDRYQRGNKSNNHLGLGLGLYVCRQIIQAHGGDIGLNQGVDQGTDIWFTLPLPPNP
ncbi:MAG: hybrid sensor histidine kinase/response regulator [Synechocystis sp.]|nr:hybrid sensor histidine kinase/response regulator [Synechocystis sp.]